MSTNTETPVLELAIVHPERVFEGVRLGLSSDDAARQDPSRGEEFTDREIALALVDKKLKWRLYGDWNSISNAEFGVISYGAARAIDHLSRLREEEV